MKFLETKEERRKRKNRERMKIYSRIQYRNNPARRAYEKAYKEAHRIQYRCTYLRRTAGVQITAAEYQRKLRAQKKRCAICGKQVPLNLDHDHQTAAVRDLLCRHCNLGIGHFFDNPALLRKAAAYLARHFTRLGYAIARPPV